MRQATSVLLALLLTAMTPAVALAERRVVYNDAGWPCELNDEGGLGKAVCRDPAAPGSRWYVCLMEQLGPGQVLSNCFNAQRQPTVNDPPMPYQVSGYDTAEIRHYTDADGVPCQLRFIGTLAKAHCFGGSYLQPLSGRPWYVCMLDQQGPIIFKDCMNSSGRVWSEEIRT